MPKGASSYRYRPRYVPRTFTGFNPGPQTPHTDFGAEFARGQIGTPRDWMLPDRTDPGIFSEDTGMLDRPERGQITNASPSTLAIPNDTAPAQIFAQLDDGGVMPAVPRARNGWEAPTDRDVFRIADKYGGRNTVAQTAANFSAFGSRAPANDPVRFAGVDLPY